MKELDLLAAFSKQTKMRGNGRCSISFVWILIIWQKTYARTGHGAIQLADRNSLLEVYNWNISMQGGLESSCSLSTYTSSLLTTLQPIILPSHTTECVQFHAANVGQAILGVLSVMNVAEAFVLYTEDYTNIIDHIHVDEVNLVLWKINSTGFINKALDGLPTYITAVILLASQSRCSEILHKTHQRQSTTTWTWILVSAEPATSWITSVRFGDRVIIIDYSRWVSYYPQSNSQSLLWNGTQVSYGLWTLSMETEDMVQLGSWDAAHGVQADLTDAWKFTKFRNKHFNVATLHWPIFHMKKEVGNKTTWSGIVIDLLKAIAKASNFTYTLHEPLDGQWGAPAVNNTWTGMVGMVYRGEVDFALAKFTITEVRDTIIDYTTPYWHEPAVIVMKKPSVDNVFTYFGPFRYELWIALVAAIPFGGLFLAFTIKIDCTIKKQPYNKRFYKTWYAATWIAFGAMVQQGSNWKPASQASRFIMGFWWFFSIVTAATYTGNLIAVLAVPKTVLPIKTLNDLAEQNEYQYGLIDNSALHSLFQFSTFHVYQTLWQKQISKKSNRVKNHLEGLERVKSDSSYIYLGELGGVAPYIYKDCDYAMGEEEFFPSSFGLIFPENSPLIPVFDEQITDLVETGMIERWKRVYYPRDECRLEKLPSSAEPASLTESQGAFILLCGCIGLAFVLLMAEIILSRILQARRT